MVWTRRFPHTDPDVLADMTILATENTVPVLEDREGAIWFGLNCGGLVRYAQGSYRVCEKYGLGSDCVWSLWQDRQGSVWAGTRYGVTRIRDATLQTYTRENSGLSDNWVTAIYEDRGGGLWFGTGNGANRLEAGAFTVYHQSDGLADDDVRFMAEDPKWRVVVRHYGRDVATGERAFSRPTRRAMACRTTS